MAMIQAVSWTIPFSAAHRLYRHESRSRFVHGHNYTVTIAVEPRNGNAIPSVMYDYAKAETMYRKWIANRLDHTLILAADDPLLDIANGRADMGLRSFPIAGEPTAGNIATMLMRCEPAIELADLGLRVQAITVSPTAEYQATEYNENHKS